MSYGLITVAEPITYKSTPTFHRQAESRLLAEPCQFIRVPGSDAKRKIAKTVTMHNLISDFKSQMHLSTGSPSNQQGPCSTEDFELRLHVIRKIFKLKMAPSLFKKNTKLNSMV
jgi:hypothetical protein